MAEAHVNREAVLVIASVYTVCALDHTHFCAGNHQQSLSRSHLATAQSHACTAETRIRSSTSTYSLTTPTTRLQLVLVTGADCLNRNSTTMRVCGRRGSLTHTYYLSYISLKGTRTLPLSASCCRLAVAVPVSAAADAAAAADDDAAAALGPLNCRCCCGQCCSHSADDTRARVIGPARAVD